jgi:hypothetical protein
MSDLPRRLHKLVGTVRLGVMMMLARTFGDYEISVHDYGFSYARYRWCGKLWAFPTGPIDETEMYLSPMQRRNRDVKA